MNPVEQEREPRVFSTPGIALLVLASVLVGLALIPGDRELMRRLMVDGRVDRAFHVMGVKDGSAALLVERLTSSEHPLNGREFLEDLRLLMPATPDPEAVYRVICARKKNIAGGTLPYVQDMLALRALQLGEADAAARIYQDLAGEGFRTTAQLRRAVATARFVSNPGLGLAFVSGHLERNRLSYEQLPKDLRTTVIALNREINNGSQAFEFLAGEAERHRGGPEMSAIMAELAQVSLEADRFEDAIPIIEGYLELTEAWRMSWEELVQRRYEQRRSDADFKKYAKTLAAYLEWNSKSGDAFEILRKLALLGDMAALDRCVTISSWCSRERDLTGLMALLYPFAERPAYNVLYARLEAQRCQYAVAEKVIRDCLSASAGDAGLWAELGQVLNEKGQFAEAIPALERAFRIDPAGQVSAQLMAAKLYVSLLRLEEALGAYKAIPAAALTQEAGDEMAALAQALSDGEAFETAGFQVLARFRKKRAVDYLQAASVWAASGNLKRAEELLCRGQSAFPGSDVLTLARIDRRVEQRDLAGAYAMLEKAHKPGDFRYVSRLMTLALDLGKAGDALQVMALPDPLGAGWHPKDRLLLAQLYVKAGREDRAMQIFLDVPGGEAGRSGLLAQKAFREGEFEKAIEHQQRYLSLAETPEAADWLFLGDLFKATGRPGEAQRTYAQLLAQIRNRALRSDLLAGDAADESDPGL